MDRNDPATVLFDALSDGHRRQILAWLRQGPLTVGALVARLPLSQPGVTKHLGVLERAGLIERRPRGRERVCTLTAEGLRPLDAWLAEYRGFWEVALDRLAEMAEEVPPDDHRDDDTADGDHDHPRHRGEP